MLPLRVILSVERNRHLSIVRNIAGDRVVSAWAVMQDRQVFSRQIGRQDGMGQHGLGNQTVLEGLQRVQME
jgi:hypothetical protein